MQRIVQYARLAQHAAIHEAFGVIQGPPIIMRPRIANPGHFKLGVPGLQPMLAQRGQVAERASDNPLYLRREYHETLLLCGARAPW